MITSFTAFILSELLLYQYPLLFTLAFLGAFAFPVPSTFSLVMASALSANGYFDFYLVAGTALAGNIAGDTAGYLVARRFGIIFFDRFGFGRKLAHGFFGSLLDFVRARPGLLIFSSRFMTEINPAVNVLAGLAHIPYRRYGPFEIAGETVYVALFSLVGYALGDAWQSGQAFISWLGLCLSLFGVFAVSVQVFLWWLRRHRGGYHENP